MQQKEIYLLPADATFSAPTLQEGYVSVFKEGAWENIEDNRGKEYWLQDDVYGTPARKMEILGALPADAMFTPPKFQSTLPYGSDSIKTNYFSINLSQAFFANRLNSNTQEFYFDVRKLLVSHSSPGCEPKLNYMFHITSHRIILHYFSSCQSICK